MHDDAGASRAPDRAVAGVGDVRPGEVVALVAANGQAWLDGYRALLARGAVPLLLDIEAPPAERQRWLALAGGTRTLGPGDDGRLRLDGPPASAPTGSGNGGEVLLCTSGTTGAPKVVRRSLSSLDAEGRRYVAWAGLGPDDRIALPLVMWHAYALGWVHAAAAAGCAVEPIPPSALGRATSALERGATVLALTPATAGLLAARAGRNRRPDHALRLVMAGAGPVSAELDTRFSDVFGMGLARNYGSTETGALFAAAVGAPPGGVGYPMAGVAARLLDGERKPVAAGEVGSLEVRVDDGPWHAMGDLAVEEPGGVRIVGRETRAVRRGDRWVAPEEIELVLGAHPSVVAARCRAAAGAGGTAVLEADVVSVQAAATDTTGLLRHLRAELAPYKVPERIRIVPEIRRGAAGKPLAERPYRLGADESLIAAAQAYKRSELVFALARLGVLDLLTGGSVPSRRIADALGLEPSACDALLRSAADIGVIVPDEPVTGADTAPLDAAPPGPAPQVRPIVELESRLSRSLVSREEIVAVATGRPCGTVPQDLGEAYQAAMHSPAAQRRTGGGLALARYRPGERLLEITCGPGRYAAAAAETGTARLVIVGWPTLRPAGHPVAVPPAEGERFDVVVVSNAVHLAGPGSDLTGLAARLRPGGRVLVDDVFLGDASGVPSVTRLDWLTHGGLFWQTVADLRAGLERAGLPVRRAVPTGDGAVTLIVAGGSGAGAPQSSEV